MNVVTQSLLCLLLPLALSALKEKAKKSPFSTDVFIDEHIVFLLLHDTFTQ